MQKIDDFTELRVLLSPDSGGNEFAIEIPDREIVSFDVELRVILNALVAERVEIGDQVAAHPVSVDQLEDPSLLPNNIAVPFFTQYRRIDIDRPAIRSITDAEIPKDLIVKFVLTSQQLIDQGKKGAGLCALDNSMIVSAGDGHRLADTDSRESFWRHRLVFGRVFDSTGRDDDALS